MSQTRLVRSETDKMIAGVCGGLAQYLGVDPVFVRGAFVLLGLASGIGIPLYIIMMIVVPSENSQANSMGELMQDSLDNLSETVSSGVSQARQHPNGRNIAAFLMIIVGAYLLLEQFGWISGSLFWPIILIGLGIALIIRRSQN